MHSQKHIIKIFNIEIVVIENVNNKISDLIDSFTNQFK